MSAPMIDPTTRLVTSKALNFPEPSFLGGPPLPLARTDSYWSSG